ncbi:hypothetical protein [Fischerella sp. PCC 9605]|nr:hypothetical protein [Fischerella sp. PCC 9605]
METVSGVMGKWERERWGDREMGRWGDKQQPTTNHQPPTNDQ